MNERILELMNEAAALAPGGESTWEDQMQYVNTFAELIVKECMSICDAEKVDYMKNKKAAWDWEEKNIYAEGAAASDSIKYKIKRSFGIE